MAQHITETLDFVKIDANTYWHDMNGNGRTEDYEKITVRTGESFETSASKFIKSNPTYFIQCPNIAYIPKVSYNSLKAYFDHPRKSALMREVDSDIKRLRSMKGRHEIYTGLLQDLIKIKEELKYTRFRYANKDEVPDGFIGVYDPFSSTMIVSYNAPTSLLIHEMDHALTAHQRIQPWGINARLKDNFGHTHIMPKDPRLPDPKKARTSFSFTLDFPKAGAKKFTYDDAKAYEHLIKSLEHGHPACLSTETVKATLANEVRGYITMCRYLLFKIGFTKDDIEQIVKSGPQAEDKKADLMERLKKHLSNSNLNYHWANGMLIYYFGIGGLSKNSHLDVFVKDYYTIMKAPGFVNPQGCKYF